MRELGDLLERLIVQLRDHPMRYALVILLGIFVLGYASSGLSSLISAVQGAKQDKVSVQLAGDALGKVNLPRADEEPKAKVDIAKPSFSCADATRWRELFICSEGGEQVDLDLRLSATYHKVARSLDAAGDRRLLASQNAWLARAELCRTTGKQGDCLIALTRDRIADLEARAEAALR